jgi:hypothetical protein
MESATSARPRHIPAPDDHPNGCPIGGHSDAYAETVVMKRLVCVLIVGLFVFGLFTSLASAQDVKPDVKAHPAVEKMVYTTHAPIRIINDGDFDTQFPGRVISGYDINGTGFSCCI